MTSKKTLANDPQEMIILNKARSFCAAQERCEYEVRAKLRLWGAVQTFANKCISTLQSEGYINEARYARLFAGGKFRMLKWGRVKIVAELRKKHVSPASIRIGLEELDEQTYLNTLRMVLNRKQLELKNEDPFIQKQKLVRFAISKGYEPELVFKTMDYESE
jgi:regulatory protein